MPSLMKRARAALGMGLLWGGAGLAVGGVFELIDNILPGALPFIRRVDMWPQTLAIPGFLGGVLFALVLGIAGRRRRFDQLSLPLFTGWGAISGVLLGGVAMAIGAPPFILGFTCALGAVGAATSLGLARMSEERVLRAGDAEVEEIGLSAQEARDLLPRE